MKPTIQPSAAWTANAERFAGFAQTYNRFRPRPPRIVADILSQLAQVQRPALVVDLGCGTGLSTRIWTCRAKRVIGIDPSDGMLQEARRRTRATNVTYLHGLSHKTGLGDACADIVMCSQSLHWMEPASTFGEAARILRKGGVFAAIDCDWPPVTASWRADRAYRELMHQIGAVERRLARAGKLPRPLMNLHRWPKEGHLQRMQQSGRFRYAREILICNVETGNADRYAGLAMSFGSAQTLLKAGMTQSQIGMAAFKRKVHRLLGPTPRPWYFSYRLRVGIV